MLCSFANKISLHVHEAARNIWIIHIYTTVILRSNQSEAVWMKKDFIFWKLYTHICRIKGCGGAGWPPPPIIFERLKLPQQIIYRRKENLSESPNHQKYWENILVSRFYEQFSRNRRNLGHFRKLKKFQTLRTQTYYISF